MPRRDCQVWADKIVAYAVTWCTSKTVANLVISERDGDWQVPKERSMRPFGLGWAGADRFDAQLEQRSPDMAGQARIAATAGPLGGCLEDAVTVAVDGARQAMCCSRADGSGARTCTTWDLTA